MNVKLRGYLLVCCLQWTIGQSANAEAVDVQNYVYYWKGHNVYHDLAFSATASGGVLTFVSCSDSERRFVSIETHRGETAESVLQRLDQAIRAGRMYGFPESLWFPGGLRIPDFPGEYSLAGTETGLGIPVGPLFLSGSYNQVKNETVFHWENPPREYDVVHPPAGNLLVSNSTSCFEVGKDLGSHSIVALRHKTLSSMGVINVNANSQEELRSAPFARGIMLNWCSWSFAKVANTAVFEQGTRPCLNLYEHPYTPDGKPFYQIVKTKTADVQAGIWRKWLGLTPGHKYRVYVRLNTLAMDSSTNNWSLSFHISANVPRGVAFTTDQLAGNAPLPDGTQGLEAAQMVTYGPGHTTKGGWVCSTMDIVLPTKVDTITTWLRHSGADSTGVGMDWIKVEDLSIGTQSK